MWIKWRTDKICHSIPFSLPLRGVVLSGAEWRLAGNETQRESALRGRRRLVLTRLNYTVLLCRSVCQITETQRTELSAYCHILRLLFTSSFCSHTHTHTHTHTQRAGFLFLGRILPGHGQNFWPIDLLLWMGVCTCWCLWQIELFIPSSPPTNKNTDRKWPLVQPSPHTHTHTHTQVSLQMEIKICCSWNCAWMFLKCVCFCVCVMFNSVYSV